VLWASPWLHPSGITSSHVSPCSDSSHLRNSSTCQASSHTRQANTLGYSFSINDTGARALVVNFLSCVLLKHLPNVETRFYCPQAFLSSGFHCRMDVSELKQTFRDLKELMCDCRMFWPSVAGPSPAGAVSCSSPASSCSPLTSGAATSTAQPLAWPGPCTTCSSCRMLKEAAQAMWTGKSGS